MDGILLESVTEARLREMLRNEMAEVLKKEFLPLSENKSKDELFSVEDASKFLKITEPTLTKYAKDGKIDSYCVGDRRVVYKKSELLDFLRKREFDIKKV